jgi:hypothetical protein
MLIIVRRHGHPFHAPSLLLSSNRRFGWNQFGSRGLSPNDRICVVAAMTTGLDHLDVSRLASIGPGFPVWPERTFAGRAKPFSLLLPITLMIGAAIWLVLPAFDNDTADGDPAPVVTPAPDTAEKGPQPASSASTEQPPAMVSEAPPAAGLIISSQSWRRAGLGSNAQVTFTLRNDNAYAVKDIEIACAFARRDGSHLTDRRRIIPVTVDPKARKRFARLHVGFVNIYADRINCSVVAANRA